MEQEQIITAWNWILAYYDEQFLEELGLPSDHNEKAKAQDFSGYQLQGFDLSSTEFGTANLTGANLSKADLSEADFGKSDCSAVNLKKTDLSSADLSNVTGLTQEQINQAVGDEDTKLPPGLTLPKSWIK